MDLKSLINEHLKTARIMQLATSVNGHPWVCSVHFYADDDFNFYWMSAPEKRHSKEIEQNPNAAITIKIHEDTPLEKYVIGVSAEGKAELMGNEMVKKIGSQYANKFEKPPTFVADILEGKKPYKLFRLNASKVVLFDTKNFPENPRQELKV